MSNIVIKAVAPSNATRHATQTVATIDIHNMTVEERKVLAAQLKLAQQADVAPLEDRRRQLEEELAGLNGEIQTMKPSNDALAVFRAVRRAVKDGKTSLDDIVEAVGYDTATVEAMLNKHATGKDGKAPLFTLKNGEYSLTPKTKKS
jgi:hypothetical protein